MTNIPHTDPDDNIPCEPEPQYDAMWRPEPTLAELEDDDRAFDVREDF